jgi:hypothetical protein
MVTLFALSVNTTNFGRNRTLAAAWARRKSNNRVA